MKVPSPRQLPSGFWFIQLRLQGVSIPITAETKAECISIAELTKAEYRSGKRAIKKTPKETTLHDAVSKFIDDSRSTLSPSTLRSYICYKNHRFPAYMDKKLPKINWQQMIDQELKDKSEKTVKNAWALVSSSLRHIGYPVPEVRLATVPVSERISYLQPEEIRKFVADVHGRSYEIPALLELHGLRLSEVRGLKWENVDLDSKVITVRGSMVRGIDGDVLKETNKTKSSTRVVPIMIPELYDAMSAVGDKTGYVAQIGSNTLLDDVKRSCKRAGITVVSNHDLRRSFASLCYFLSIPEIQIMEWGGWQDRGTLRKIYLRLAASSRSKSKDDFQNFFEQKGKKNTEAKTSVQMQA